MMAMKVMKKPAMKAMKAMKVMKPKTVMKWKLPTAKKAMKEKMKKEGHERDEEQGSREGHDGDEEKDSHQGKGSHEDNAGDEQQMSWSQAEQQKIGSWSPEQDSHEGHEHDQEKGSHQGKWLFCPLEAGPGSYATPRQP